MPGFEQPRQESYIPQFSSIKDLGEHPELTFDEDVREVARLKFELEHETVELLKQVHEIENLEMHDKLQEIVKLIALTDLPDAEKMKGVDRQKLEHVRDLIKDIKKELDE